MIILFCKIVSIIHSPIIFIINLLLFHRNVSGPFTATELNIPTKIQYIEDIHF